MVSIEKNITSVKQRIEQAATQAGRDPDSIKLLAVSKTRSINDIQIAFAAGLNALVKTMCKRPQIKYSHWMP